LHFARLSHLDVSCVVVTILTFHMADKRVCWNMDSHWTEEAN